MTSQEIYDTVVQHLRNQGKKALAPDGSCMYRNTFGEKCAIGCLIPDKFYSTSLEGLGVSNSYEVRKILRDLGIESFQLLVRLQEIHDYRELTTWEHHFKALASKSYLKELPL